MGVGEGSPWRPPRSPGARVEPHLPPSGGSDARGKAASPLDPEIRGVLALSGPRRKKQESLPKESSAGHAQGTKAAPRTGTIRRLLLSPASPLR